MKTWTRLNSSFYKNTAIASEYVSNHDVGGQQFMEADDSKASLALEIACKQGCVTPDNTE
jgi:hypothetical protein